jgi:hypothetical protein
MEDELRKELMGAIVNKLNESSVSDLHQLVEILYEEELDQLNITH